MKQVIIYQTEDGVAVVHPSGRIPIEEVAAKDVPEGVSFTIIDADSLPDRYFREAWRFDGPTGVKVNMNAAKDVQRNRWRRLRAPKLAALDVDFMQALEETGTAKKNEIKAKKQALRDVTLTELPDDLEAIKNTIPEILL